MIVLPEACEPKGAPIGNPFSAWWKDRVTRPSAYADDGISRLEAVLNSATVFNAIGSAPMDGRRLAVAYALFDFGPGPGSLPSAKPEAAHAVVAWRYNVPLPGIGLDPE